MYANFVVHSTEINQKQKSVKTTIKNVRKLPIQNTRLTNQIIQEDRKKYVLSLMMEVHSGIQECNHL